MTKKDKLSDAIENIEDKLIEEARDAHEGKPGKKKRALRFVAGFTAAAAAITGVTTGVLLYNGNNGIPVEQPPAVVTTDGTQTTEPGPAETTAMSGDTDVPVGDEVKPLMRTRLSNGIVDKIEAVDMKEKRVAANTSFKLTLAAGAEISEDELKSRLVVTPKNEFVVKREADGSFLLNTSAPFADGSVVKLAVADEDGEVYDSWAFQTEESFRVLSTYPGDGIDSAGIDSGIEIDFSMPVDTTDVDKYFEITPKLEGRFDTTGGKKNNYATYRNTLYFIPKEKMSVNTKYTVTLKKGLKSAECGELAEDFTFSFKTSRDLHDDYFYTYNGSSETFIGGDPCVIEVQMSESLKNNLDFETVLYRFDSADTYREALAADVNEGWGGGETFDTSGLKEVFRSKEPPHEARVSWKPYNIILPDDLEEGYYIANITAHDMTAQYFIQIDPVSVFALSLGENNVFFVNDTNTGRPAVGAKVSLTVDGKTVTGTVGADGIARVEASAGGKAVLEVTYGSHRFVDVISVYGTQSGMSGYYDYYYDDYNDYSYDYRYSKSYDYAEKFYNFIYTDREAYLSSDTVNVWGLVLPKRDGAVLPGETYLVFGGSETSGYKQPAKLNPDGSFSGSFTYRDRQETYWMNISLVDGDNNVITSKQIAVRDYVKPTYTLDLTLPEYAILPQDDPITAKVDANFFEGTPADGLKFTYETGGKSEPSVLVTDGSGTAEATVTAGTKADVWRGSNDSDSWRLSNMYVKYTLTGVENEYSSVDGTIPAFYRNVMLETGYDEKTHTISFNTWDMDFSRIEEFLANTESDSWSYYARDYDLLKGAPSDTEIKVTVTHNWSEAVKSGTYYDYLEKRNVDTYEYVYHEDKIGTFTVNTANGKGTLTNSGFGSEKGSYSVDINYKDSKGRPVNQYFYFYNGGDDLYSPYMKSGWYSYYLYPDKEHEYRSGDYYYYNYDGMGSNSRTPNAKFREGDTIRFDLSCTMDDGVKNNGRILFAVNQLGFVSTDVFEGSEFSYSPELSCIPDANYCGAYFDGRHVFPIYGGNLYFDPEERGIQLTVETDRDSYDAGDTVKLKVVARDMNGAPIYDSTVTVSVVDEAVFELFPQNIDMLQSLYAYIRYRQPRMYYSYIQHVLSTDSMGEKGGGGADPEPRKDFRDTAFFGTAKTDSNGVAEFEFTLPDNLTTWRATVMSFSEEENGRLFAGNTKAPIVASRPVFITPVMLDTFTEGDDIAVSAKCHGIDDSDTMTVTITGEGVDKTLTINPGKTANFGKLPKGDYTVLFKASKDGKSDAVEMPLTVAETQLESNITKTFLLEDGIEIDPTKWPADFTLFNKEYMFCTDILRQLAWHGGRRLDTAMAASWSGVEFGWYDAENFNRAYLQYTENGLARILPAAQGDPELTALICAAFPDAVNKTLVAEALRNSMSEERYVACAYMGLAAIGEPILNELREYASPAKINTLNLYDKLFIADALALCGDYTTAYDVYNAAVPRVMVNDSDPEKITAYIPTGTDRAAATRYALVTASLLKLPEADYLARYVYNYEDFIYDPDIIPNSRESNSSALQLVIYVQNYVPKTNAVASFSFMLNGVKQDVTLDRHRGYYISFGEEQWKNADIKVTSGSIYGIVSYTGRINEHDSAPTVAITKTYTTGSGGIQKNNLSEACVGDTVKVSFVTSPHAVIYDVIPSCGRFIETDKGWVVRSGQRVRLYADAYGNASYRFRVCTEGEFVVESAVADDSYMTGPWGESGRAVIKVGEGSEA